MRRGTRLLGLASAWGLASGCPTLEAYQCERDADCNRAGLEGRCLADAACAYPESEGRCESGWARSVNAADAPGACVDEEPPPNPTTNPDPTLASSDGSTSTTDASTSAASTETGDGSAPCGWTATLDVETPLFSPGTGLSDFVLWVPLQDAGLDAQLEDASLGLRITAEDGTILPYEREDGVDGTPALWLHLPDFDADATVRVSFEFKPGLTPPGPAEVWSPTLIGVWHLDDVPTGLEDAPVTNSVRPPDAGTMRGSMEVEQHVAGVTGPALAFDGDDDIVLVPNSFTGMLDAYTVSFWARTDSTDGSLVGSFFQRLNGDFFYPRCWHGASGVGRVICQHEVAGAVASTSSDDPLEQGEFIHVAFTRDPSTQTTTLLVRGETEGEIDDPKGTLDTNEQAYPLEIGRGEWGSLLGVIDEFRVSDRALPQAHIRADYRSQVAPGASLTFGTPSTLNCPD
ncbi:MAG: LamG domain-containing protein [Myxococcota bacterium]